MGSQTSKSTFRPRSKFLPPFTLSPAIQTFFNVVKREIVELPINKFSNQNLSFQERQAIQSLGNNKLFTIKEADKGGNVVLWPIELYVGEVHRQLGNSRYYCKLPSDPTDVFKRKLDRLLTSARDYGIINKNEYAFLITEKPTIPTFYVLPKIHKDPSAPPGRPIVAGIGGLCEKACVFIDYYLQPLVIKLPSHLKDTTSVIQQFEEFPLDQQTFLVTLDVESLYTNISHHHGMAAISYFLNSCVDRNRMLDSFLIDLLDFVLQHNYFLFDSSYYRQVSGTAMGARCAPSYANLFLGWWEVTHVYPSNPFQNQVLKWARYIDDVIFVWSGTKEDCLSFIEMLNDNELNIHLTSHFSDATIDFLDLTLKCDGDRITTSLYRKPTSTNSLLQFDSFHPQHLKKGIPYSQYLRLKRNCMDETDFKKHASELTLRFQQRGYPKKLLSQAYRRALKRDRASLFQPKLKTDTQALRLITTYNNRWPEIRGILQRHWHILNTDCRLGPILPKTPLLTARRAPNLKDRLMHSHFVRPKESLGRGFRTTGSFPCGDCNVCGFMTPTNIFKNPQNNETTVLKSFINCRTRNVIYGLICPCAKLYIGQTSQLLKQRVQKHFSTISLAQRDKDQGKKLTTIAEHYLEHHAGRYVGTKIVGLERVLGNGRGGDIGIALLRKESRWIFETNSLYPDGLNAELLFSGYL